jgi:hypothetical protein
MATGLPDLEFLELTEGTMPGRMRLDTFEASWERHIANENRLFTAVEMEANSLFSIEMFKSGTIFATLEARVSESSEWISVFSANAKATATVGVAGFQYEYRNVEPTYTQFRLEVLTTSGTPEITEAQASVDVLYNGTKRRRVINAIGSVETNTASAYSDESEAFTIQADVTDPVFYIAPNNVSNPMKAKTLLGKYFIDRISVDRGDGRQAIILMSITREGAWVDE